jgi:hypothetical protein
MVRQSDCFVRRDPLGPIYCCKIAIALIDPAPAFDAALGRELHEVIQEAKRMASQIQQSSDLWTWNIT